MFSLALVVCASSVFVKGVAPAEEKKENKKPIIRAKLAVNNPYYSSTILYQYIANEPLTYKEQCSTVYLSNKYNKYNKKTIQSNDLLVNCSTQIDNAMDLIPNNYSDKKKLKYHNKVLMSVLPKDFFIPLKFLIKEDGTVTKEGEIVTIETSEFTIELTCTNKPNDFNKVLLKAIEKSREKPNFFAGNKKEDENKKALLEKEIITYKQDKLIHGPNCDPFIKINRNQ